jgi:hypothetical protein
VATSASQRTTLIKAICRNLGEDKWSLIDLILVQFSLSTIETWGAAGRYVSLRRSSASDLEEPQGFAALSPTAQAQSADGTKGVRIDFYE